MIWQKAKNDQTKALMYLLYHLKKSVCKKGRNLIFPAYPKSGTTYFGQLLREYSNFDIRFLKYYSGFAEHQIYVPYVINNYCKNTITFDGIMANEGQLNVIKKFELEVVAVHVRNIYDWLISVRDHMKQQTPRFTMFYANQDVLNFSDEQLHDFLVDMAAPWAIQFYAIWDRAKRNGDVDFVWSTYEDLTSNKHEHIQMILERLNLKINDDLIIELDDKLKEKKVYTNKNVGKKGRGIELLNAEQINKINRLTHYYPDVDFSRIGISH